MAQYSITFSCGHTGTVNLIGNNREKRIEYLKNHGKCSDCYKKELAEKKAAAFKKCKEEAKKLELINLEGSNKQIEWAIQIRQGFISQYNFYLNKMKEEDKILYNKYHSIMKNSEDLFEYLLSINSAKFFIENRSKELYEILEKVLELKNEIIYEETSEEELLQKEQLAVLEAENKRESTIMVNSENIVANIVVDNNKVQVFSTYNALLKEILKSLNFKWQNPWTYVVKSETDGNVIDVAVELGVKLIENGINVLSFDNEIKNKILAKDYIPRHKKWLILNKYNELRLKDYNNLNSLYKLCNSNHLLGKWEASGFTVSVENYQQLLDFCSNNDFKITDKAYKFIEGFAGTDNMKTMKERKNELCDD
ncbi:MAG: hypothetical protein ACLVAK_07970 [Clostridia bacterium]